MTKREVSKPSKARALAKLFGAKTYFANIPCKNGHNTHRRTDNGCCVACVKVLKRALSAAGYHRERHKANPVYWLLQSAAQRAKRKRLPFTITAADIKVPELCPALGIKLSVTSGGKAGPASPSLDRIRPELGYVPGNIAVISYLANCIKSSANAQQVRAVADWIERVSVET